MVRVVAVAVVDVVRALRTVAKEFSARTFGAVGNNLVAAYVANTLLYVLARTGTSIVSG